MCLHQIQDDLKKIAFQKTLPFCYSCYKVAMTGTCKICHSDDLMRLLPDYGVEYGIDWVIENLIKENLEAINEEEFFIEMLTSCYPETTQVGFLTLDTVDTMKDQDPIAFDIASGEYIDSLSQDEQIMSFGSDYYSTQEIESYIKNELD